MKKILFFLILLLSNNVYSQIVDSIVFLPKNPTVNDTMTILCYVHYPSIGCPMEKKEFYYGFNNSIILKAFHCMGMISMVCYTVDTFFIPMPQNYPGKYTIYYMPGYIYDYPCTFPIDSSGDTIPYPFTVASQEIFVSPTDIIEIKGNINSHIFISPNPFSEMVYFESESLFDFSFYLFDLTGKKIIESYFTSGKLQLDLSMLPSGIYFYQIISEENFLTGKLLKN